MAEITVIAPQQEIADLVRELGWKSPEVDVVRARLEHGVAIAREAAARGSKVLVSTGVDSPYDNRRLAGHRRRGNQV